MDWTDTVPLPTPRPCADAVGLPVPPDDVTTMLLDFWAVVVGTVCRAVIVALAEDETFNGPEPDAVPLPAENA